MFVSMPHAYVYVAKGVIKIWKQTCIYKKKKKSGREEKYPGLDEKTRNSDRHKARRGGFKKLESSVHSNHSRNHLSPTVLFHHTQLAQNTKPELGEGGGVKPIILLYFPLQNRLKIYLYIFELTPPRFFFF